MLVISVLTLALLGIFSVTARISNKEIERGTPPFIVFVGGYYFLFFGVLSWFAAAYVKHLPYDRHVSVAAALFIVAFVAIQVAGYVLAFRLVPARDVPQRAVPAGPLLLVAWGGIVLALLFYFVPALSTLPSIPQLRQPGWYFAVAVMSYLILQRRLSRLQGCAFAAAVAAKLVLDLRNGELTHMVFSAIIILNAALLFRRHVLAICCVALCLTAISSYGYIKHFSRTVIADGPAPIFEFQPEITTDNLFASVAAMARRSSAALLTSHIIARTPETVPFEARNPFLDAAVNHVPRVVWPGKPLENFGNVFGRRYGILEADDNRTSWNICWTADFYITGGFAWALAGIFIVGLLLGLGNALLSRHADRIFSFGLYAATIFPLFYQESNFSVMAGSVLWSAAFLLLSYWIARRLFRLPGRRATAADAAAPDR
jgi:hypothetical protein